MKVYNIKPQTVKVADFEMDAISLGESGRGRKCVNVACPKEFEFLEVGTTKAGKPRLNKSSNPQGWIARISTQGAYIRGASGNISVSQKFADRVTVVARGQGAFGDAGRIGTWDDIIISCQLEDFWLRVKPSRGDAYILFFRNNLASDLTYPEAELLDFDFSGSSLTNRGELIRL